MPTPAPTRMTSTTLLSATLMSLCGIGQAASAPVLTGASFTLTGIVEDASQAGLLGNTFNDQLDLIYSDPGANFRGVAVVAINGSHGKWQYTSFEQFGALTQWFDIPLSISASNALLLSIGTFQYSAVRFVPDADFNTLILPAPTISVRAWNGVDTDFSATSGAAQVFGDASVNGGTSSYSAVAALAAVTVDPVNDAPVLSVTVQSALGGFPGSAGFSGTVAIGTMLSAGANGGTAPIIDVDDNALQGIAIVGADSTHGSWQFTVDGSTFQTFPGLLDDTHALLLAAVTDGYTGATGMAVRFVPNANFRGTATFSYRAWDQSQQVFSQSSGAINVDVSASGGTTPYSVAVRTANIRILNSAPAMTANTSTLPVLVQDAAATTIAGVTLASLFAGSFSDPDFNPEGAAVTGADNAHGSWQFTTDNSLGGASSWTDMGAVSASQALLLHFAASTYNTTNTAIRFVPAAGFATATNALPTITLRAWDETLGSSSANAQPTTADLATDRAVNGSASAFGATDIVLTQAVTAGIVVVPPVSVAHVTVPPIGISTGASVIYAGICPSTNEGIANLTARLSGTAKNQVRAFTWDGSTQAYVELPRVPSDGLTDSTGVFIATRLELGLDFSGTPTPFPFAITLHPGFNFVGVPPLGTLSAFSTVHQFPGDFTVFDGAITVTDPLQIANLIGTPGGDITTARPFFWNGSAYVQEAAVTTGEGYWIKNNSSADITLTRIAPAISPGLQGAVFSATASMGQRSSAAAANVHDRGVPPPPPGGSSSGGSSTAASGSGSAKSCGLGSGVAAFASMLMLALRRRLRGGRSD